MIAKSTSYIAEQLGLRSQLGQLQEESAELIVAISKFLRQSDEHADLVGEPISRSLEHLIEEVADVQFMLMQVIDLMSLEAEVVEMIKFKAKRTLGRLAEEKNGNDKSNNVDNHAGNEPFNDSSAGS